MNQNPNDEQCQRPWSSKGPCLACMTSGGNPLHSDPGFASPCQAEEELVQGTIGWRGQGFPTGSCD